VTIKGGLINMHGFKNLAIRWVLFLFLMNNVVGCANTLQGMKKDINNLGNDNSAQSTTIITNSPSGVSATTTNAKPPITSMPPPSPSQ